MSVPCCPRCGYDQSGAMAAWEREEPPQCPVSGVCSECGLAFLWRDLLRPEYSRLGRFFEHARHRRVSSLVLTAWISARAGALWRWVRLEHEIVWRRAALFCALLMLLGYGATVGAIAAVECIRQATPVPWVARPAPVGVAFIHTVGFWDAVLPVCDRADSWVLWTFGPSWGTYRIMPLAAVALATVALAPLCFVLLPQTIRRARVRRAHLARVFLYSLAWLPVVVFLAQPVSWGADRLWEVLGLPDAKPLPGSIFEFWQLRWWVLLGIVLLWQVWWWRAAARHYLRLPHAALVALTMTVIAAMLSVLGIVLTGGGVWLVSGVFGEAAG